ncbi:hypothetical protein PGT2_g00013 [Escherichia phage PGT2]|uniref:Uncharacterized protein n=1 Tax=Escherichia phage PGT2 TaxID=2047782 RepID=A0A2D2W2R7_9CAUD|nr:hypothetical protein HOS43_gp13 [Escherichia phage PGT2]ATS92431.1 hypothetical protein PGT2_g00013 [Escherichia phage PGT2]
MELSDDELRLIRRALAFAVRHLHVCADEARDNHRIKEKLDCQVEAARLTTLSEKLHGQIIKQLKAKSQNTTRGTEGCGARCTNLCAAGACPNRQSD